LTTRVSFGRIVRTRNIVAIAVLIAASALVAGPEDTGARVSSVAQTLDSAQFRAVSLELPSDAPATSITPTVDLANRSAGWLGPATALADAGTTATVAGARPLAPQPTVRAKATPRNRWHFDGNISWYGPGMYGSRTACGVTLTKTVMGVASRTLPCGTKVTFRNPENGRTVTVPVIDRGPYVDGRIWDMSAGLCLYLDHCYTGTMKWKLADE
jgi:rare lipoprotein A (peptidoglycan hydrolase)